MMNLAKINSIFAHRLAHLIVITLTIAGGAVAQNATRVTGELSQAKLTTLNGRTAVAGSTVFNQNLIKTGQAGSAVVSLGKLGRIEIAQNSELAMLCNNVNVGGQLRNGRTVVSAPQGVAISVQTSNGLINSDPGQATILTIEQNADQMRVIAHRGAAKIAAGNRAEPILAGEEVTFNARSKSGWQRKRLVAAGAGVGSASLLALTAGKSASPLLKTATTTTTVAKTSFTSLFNAGLNYSLSRVAAPPIRHPEVFFEGNITCRDSESILCRRKSQSAP